MPFITNKGSLEQISNIIEEKYSEINVSQLSSNDNGLGSNLSEILGALASQNIHISGQITNSHQNTNDQLLSTSSEDTQQFKDKLKLNLGKVDMGEQREVGEITDLKKKIHERDECILELVKKINKIEQCVQTLQSNNVVINPNDRPKTNQTYKSTNQSEQQVL